jgi:uncharacterized membrane protein
VPGIGHQRDRLRQETGNALDNHEQDVERDADRKGAVERQRAVMMAAGAVAMPFAMLVAVAVVMAVIVVMTVIVVMIVRMVVAIMIVRGMHYGPCLAPRGREILGHEATIGVFGFDPIFGR